MVDFPVKQGLFRYNMMDHHAILGAPLDMGGPEIRQRYLKIAHLLHPDTCKLKNESEKRRAIQLFSKLVNPAYEILSREASLTEQVLVISQIAKGLIPEQDKITLTNEDSQQLLQAKHKLDLVYHQLLHPLITDLYGDLETVFEKIAHISELNLIYLMMKSGQSISVKTQSLTTVSSPVRPKSDATFVTQSAPLKEEPKKETPKTTPQETYYRRAQEQYDRGNYSEAIAELREVLKLDPKDSKAHCLLGLSFLKNKMATMAKVHINMAWELNRQDPMIVMAKKELDKVIPPDNKKEDSKSTKSDCLADFSGARKSKIGKLTLRLTIFDLLF
jgi:tetratricopeptide (TPR) repeat protein